MFIIISADIKLEVFKNYFAMIYTIDFTNVRYIMDIKMYYRIIIKDIDIIGVNIKDKL